ncbi:MAG TPA: GAF domain-containing protein, partial [Vicinamibacterales bacterium]|nr:GAF domain-containing protein [Vicinamibacterales bacterium]
MAALATAGLGYRAFQDELALNAERQSALTTDKSIGETAELLLDLRASLHAYVAPSQGLPFWGKRAQEGIETLRQQLISLDQQVTPAGGSLKQSVDAVAQLAAAEGRARTYVSRDEMQLAGDVIFTEIRDVLAGMTADVQSIRDSVRRDHDTRAARIRQEQLMLAGGALALWIVVALLLLPVGHKPAAVEDPAQWRANLKETLNKSASAREDSGELRRDLAEAASGREGGPPPAVVAGVGLSTLQAASEICADLSALGDPGALPGTLERVSAMLNATGLIVWVASNDGGSLSPVATHGFDPKLVHRIGRIPRDSANLTASAFRDNAPKISLPSATAPGALAVPMCGPTGPTGVLSVEMRAGQAVEEATVALAAIIGAQLATLTMPIADPVVQS